jgi:hypothetical protein
VGKGTKFIVALPANAESAAIAAEAVETSGPLAAARSVSEPPPPISGGGEPVDIS